MSPSRAEAWARYWLTGAPHSCTGSYGDTYGGPFETFWRSAFAPLRPDDRVLDLACGNAPLSRMLLSQRHEPGLRCDAVDLAEIHPAWAVGEPRLQVHPGIAAESLPLPDGAFQLVVSQYGLEYTDLRRSVAEVQRVRAARSAVRLALHHADSLPVTLAKAELADLDWACGDDGLLAAAEAILGPVTLARTAAGRQALAGNPAADAARERFNSAQDTASQRLQVSRSPGAVLELRDAVAQVLATLQRSGDQAAAVVQVEGLRASLEDSRLRLRELCLHAFDAHDARALAETLKRPNEHAHLQPLLDDGRLMAWGLTVEPMAV